MKLLINCAVFASGNGSNFQALVDAGKIKELGDVSIKLLVTDKQDAFARQRAQQEGIKEICVSPAAFPSKDAYEQELVRVLENEHIQLVLLAGYMRILGKRFVGQYRNRIINIHPSLLPTYPGVNAIARAFQARDKETGVTVHFVDEKVDHGPIILQERVSIDPGDTVYTLEEKVHRVEHRLYPKVVRLYADGRLKFDENGRVRIT